MDRSIICFCFSIALNRPFAQESVFCAPVGFTCCGFPGFFLQMWYLNAPSGFLRGLRAGGGGDVRQ